MSKLDKLIKELCPDGVEYKTLGEVGKVCMCKRIMKNQTEPTGDIPFYKIGTFGKKADSFISKELFEEYKSKFSFPKKGDILISAAGTIGRTVIYDGAPAYYQDSNIVWIDNDETEVLNKWLFYCYQTSPWQVSTGGTIARLYNDNISKAKIPVPPLPVQEEIVRILDTFTSLTAELTAELTARRKQYEYYRDSLFENYDGINGTILDMLSQPITDGPHTTPKLVNKGIPFISATAVYDGKIHLDDAKGFISEEFDLECCKKYKPQKNDVFMVKSGSTTGKVAFVDTDSRFNIWSPLAAMRTNKNNSPRFLYHLLQTNNIQKQVQEKMSHGSQPNLSMRVLESFSVKIPTLEQQNKIVDILDKLDIICNDISSGLPAEIEARQKQYEYYRDKLLTFEEKEV